MAKMTKLLNQVNEERNSEGSGGSNGDPKAIDDDKFLEQDRRMFQGEKGVNNIYDKLYMPKYERSDRTKLFRFGRYQRPLARAFVLISLGFCVFISAVVLMFNRDWVNMVLYNNRTPSIRFVGSLYIYILAAIWMVFAYLMVWTAQLTNKLLGAFERIIREVDKSLESKKSRSIRARAGDYPVVTDLINRINLLLAKLPDEDKKS